MDSSLAYLPTLRSGRLLPVNPLPELPAYPEPAVAGSRGRGLLVSSGSFMPEDPVSVDSDCGCPSTPDLILVVEAASVFVGILEEEDELFIPEVVPVVPEPSPEVALEVGFLVEERGSFVPVLLLPKWLPWPAAVPVVPV